MEVIIIFSITCFCQAFFCKLGERYADNVVDKHEKTTLRPSKDESGSAE